MKTHRTWHDLVPPEPPAATPQPQPNEVPTSPVAHLLTRPAPGPGSSFALPPEMLAIIQEYEQAERRLRQLTGHAPPSEVDAREAARFPLKTHTAQSRLEERRLAHRDEQASAAKKAMQEVRIVDQRRQSEIARAMTDRRDALRHAARDERLALERERQRQADRARDQLVAAQLVQHWERERRRALAAAALRRRSMRAHETRQLDEVRARRIQTRRDTERAEQPRRVPPEHRRSSHQDDELDDARRERAVQRRRERHADG